MAEIHVLIQVHASGVPVVREWLATLHGRVAGITASTSSLKDEDFGVPLFVDRGITPILSPVEERAVREVSFHRVALSHRLRDFQVSGVPFADDLAITIGQSLEYTSIMSRSVAALVHAGYDHIVIILENYSYCQMALLREARACGLAPDDAVPWSLHTNSFVRVPQLMAEDDIDAYVNSVRSLAAESTQQSAERIERLGSARGGTIFLIKTTGAVYADSMAEILRALNERDEPVHVMTFWPSMGDVWKTRYGFDSHNIISPTDRSPADPSRLAETLEHFLKAYRGDVDARLRQHAIQTNPLYGFHTCDFVDAGCFFVPFFGALVDYAVAIERFDQIIAELRPNAIYCAPGASMMGNGIAQLARNHGVRTVTSAFTSVSNEFRSIPAMSYRADFTTVIGEDQVCHFAARAFPAETIVPVGQPDMDPVRTHWSKAQCDAYLAERFPTYDPAKHALVIATSSVEHEMDIPYTEYLGEIAQVRGDTQVILKMHPTRNLTPFHALLHRRPDLPLLLVTNPGDEIYAYLGAAGIVLTDISHVGKRAVFFGKSMIVVNFTGTPYDFTRYDEEGVALLATTLDELSDAVTRLLDDPAAREQLVAHHHDFLRHYMFSNDGRSGDRVADLLMYGRGGTKPPAPPVIPEAPPVPYLTRLWRGIRRIMEE